MKLSSFLAIGLLSLPLPAAAQQAQGVLWRDPGSIASRDLYWGNGSEANAPKPPFTFVEEKTGGATAKVVVTDARGASWDVKFGSEANAEVAAGRILWAFGYPVEEMYFVPSGKIEGAKKLERAREYIKDDGSFSAARFELNDPKMVEGEGWAIASNPFTGTKEMSGLLILFALINNWDTDLAKNQAIYAVTTDKGAEQWYIADDIGASFGRFDDPPKKWMLEEYRKDKLIASVEPDAIVLNYRAYGNPPTRIPMEHARWFAAMASELTRDQVKRAFEAAGTPAGEIDGFVDVFMSKLGELMAAVGNSNPLRLRVRLLVLRQQ